MTLKQLAHRRALLERLRKQLGLRKAVFAARIGLSPSQYSNMLTRRQAMPIETALYVAAMLHRLPREIEPTHQRIYIAMTQYITAQREWLNQRAKESA